MLKSTIQQMRQHTIHASNFCTNPHIEHATAFCTVSPPYRFLQWIYQQRCLTHKKWRFGENIIGLSKLWARVVVAVPWSVFNQESILLVNRHKCLYRKVALLLVRMLRCLSYVDEDMKHSTDPEVTLESDKPYGTADVTAWSADAIISHCPLLKITGPFCKARLSTNCPNLSTSPAFYLTG